MKRKGNNNTQMPNVFTQLRSKLLCLCVCDKEHRACVWACWCVVFIFFFYSSRFFLFTFVWKWKEKTTFSSYARKSVRRMLLFYCSGKSIVLYLKFEYKLHTKTRHLPQKSIHRERANNKLLCIWINFSVRKRFLFRWNRNKKITFSQPANLKKNHARTHWQARARVQRQTQTHASLCTVHTNTSMRSDKWKAHKINLFVLSDFRCFQLLRVYFDSHTLIFPCSTNIREQRHQTPTSYRNRLNYSFRVFSKKKLTLAHNFFGKFHFDTKQENESEKFGKHSKTTRSSSIKRYFE